MKPIRTVLIFVSLISSWSFSQDNTALEKLVETEKSFAKTANDKSVKHAFLEFFSDDGVVFQPTAVNARKTWQKNPDASPLLVWNPVWADISSDKNIGYTTGDWDIRPKNQPEISFGFGQYVTIWKKQTDGEFKAVLDIGISHDKPAAVQKTWTSPKRSPADTASNPTDPVREIAEPGLKFLKPAELEKMFAEDVRLYRDKHFPFIGKEKALAQVQAEQADLISGRVIDSKTGGADDFWYAYGILELTSKNREVSKVNMLRIWRLRNGQWKTTLELTIPIK